MIYYCYTKSFCSLLSGISLFISISLFSRHSFEVNENPLSGFGGGGVKIFKEIFSLFPSATHFKAIIKKSSICSWAFLRHSVKRQIGFEHRDK